MRPTLPIRPVARWQLRMALTLSVPWRRLVDPLRIQRDHARRRCKHLKNSATSRSVNPVASAVAATLPAMLRARATASSSPEV